MTALDTNSEAPEKHKRENTIIRSTLLLMVLFFITKMISLGQTVIIAQYLGLESEMDAYVAANGIPDLIVLLISAGALGHAFIPIFSSYLARGEKIDAYRLASHVLNTVLVVALIISVTVFVFAPWLIANVIAPGFVEDPETLTQAIWMMRLLLISSILFAISGIFTGVLHSHNQFLLPAISPIMYDLGILFGVVFLLKPFGIYGVAIGTVLGAGGHVLIQVPGLFRNSAKWFPELGFKILWDRSTRWFRVQFTDPMLRKVFWLMIPRALGLGVFQLNWFVMRNIASQMGEGGIAALDWGWRVMQIPETLIGTAMGIVIFPTLAALSEVQDTDGKRNAMSGALKFIMVASIPSAIGLILIGQPLLSLLERGAFDASATSLVYSTLSMFTLGLIVHSMLEVIARSFYADKDTWTPLWAALGGAAINLVLSIWLSGVLASENPPIENVMWLAFANSMGVAFEVAVLAFLLRKRWHGINENSVVVTTVKTLIASLIMGAAVLVIGQIFSLLSLEGRLIYTLVQLGLQVLVGGLVFLGATLLLGMDEVKDILRILLRRNRAQLESIQTA